MNDYELLKNIFKNFKVNEKNIPVDYLRYRGKERTYVTYSFINDEPELFAEDKELASVVTIDIDIFSESNFLAIEKEIKTLMELNNFIRIGCSPDMYEEDTGLYHKTIEYEKERMI